ncbi:S ribonuclease [Pyrus ussuriensis x Pyrus communis]|uniref:S ribonuclease n=1 Tax=Pyrus ussuriensis x Pyrus communis TaxID=2448454 RepID=A0A5N5FFW1_9ROSA|nr:S ribonuclease [Pyrus ussuriensis x Pyrus communis]
MNLFSQCMTRSSQPIRERISDFDSDFERTLRRRKKHHESNPPSPEPELDEQGLEEEEEATAGIFEEPQDMAVDNRTLKELSASGLANAAPLFLQTKNEEDEKDILETFRKVHVNIPLLDAIKQIPKYAKFLKKICTTRKRIREKEVVHVSENVSAILQRKLPPKCKDPGALKNDGVVIQLADRSNAYPRGVLEDVLVQRGTTFIPTTKSKSGRKMVNFPHKADRCLKLPGINLFSPGMMGYKAQVVASTIALPIRRKIENGGRSTARTVDFRGLKPPHTVVNQGGS